MKFDLIGARLAKKLRLRRPLVWLDLEWTGPGSRLFEGSFVRVMPDGQVSEWHQRWNPQEPLTDEVIELCGVTDADLAEEPAFADTAHRLWGSLLAVDFAGYGIVRFDLPNLQAEFERHQVYFDWEDALTLDVYQLWLRYEPRSLADAVRKFVGTEHDQAHEAHADTLAAMDVAAAMFEHFEIDSSLAELGEELIDATWIDRQGKLRWEGDQAVLAVGKHKGQRLADLAKKKSGYLYWMLDSNFPRDTKEIIREALAGNLPVKNDAISG